MGTLREHQCTFVISSSYNKKYFRKNRREIQSTVYDQ